MAFSGMCCHVRLVRTEASEEFAASFFGVERIRELGTLTTSIPSYY
jgi:hypothetical protein